jgi:hypothetical protein
MSIREDVLEILRSSAVSRIRFSFTSFYGTPVSVDSTTFQRVVSAIESGQVRVWGEGVSAGSGGEYDNTAENGGDLYSRPIRDRRTRKSVVIHEAVHASIDLTRSTIEEVDNEAAAFLAQFLYLRFTSYSISELLSDNPREARLYESLWRAAGSIERGGSVSGPQMAQIRHRISVHPNYPEVLSEGCVDGESECFYTVFAHNG